jgi:hypothetical protein
MIKRFLKTILPIAAMGFGLATAGCDNMNITIGDGDEVPLSELDLTGEAPTKLVLASPDDVLITEGEKLDIKVSGDPDAVAALRFNIDDDTLGIMRDKGYKGDGKANVAVVMPPAREFVLAGSGEIQAPSLVDKAEINIAGSGTVSIAKIAASKLQVNMMGSGTFNGAGTAERLEYNVAGSGKLAARGLKVDRAEVNIAGSGGGEFASDGKVEARVAGSGEVTVYGRAACKISAMGSGKLRCVGGEAAWDDNDRSPPEAPAAPKPLEAPAPPKLSE